MRKMFSENQIKNIVNQGIESGDIAVKFSKSENEYTFESPVSSLVLNEEQRAIVESSSLILLGIYNNDNDFQYIGIITPQMNANVSEYDDGLEFTKNYMIAYDKNTHTLAIDGVSNWESLTLTLIKIL